MASREARARRGRAVALPARLGARVLATVFVVLAVAGCGERESPLNVEPRLAEVATSDIQELFLGEADFVAIANAEPTFAGYYLDGLNFVAATTDATRASAVRALVDQRLSALKEERVAPPSAVVEVRAAEYSFLQLSEWRNLAYKNVLGLEDVVSLDLDERLNRVRISLGDGSGSESVQRALALEGVPAEAVVLEITGPSVVASTLLDKKRPLQGGYYIITKDGSGQIEACAMGFNALLNGNRVFLTNSHCTRTQFASDDSDAYQIYSSAPSNFIGDEYSDPAGWDCTPWWEWWEPDLCRNSDAAAFLHSQPADSVDYGYIARTQSRATGSSAGSTTIDNANPRFAIAGEQAWPFSGQSINKIGPRGGWTYGNVTSTCESPGFSNPHGGGDFRVICAYKANYRSDPGDSGGPVFTWSSGSSVILAGLNFGSDNSYSGEGVGKGWFTPMGAIEADLGPLTVFDAPPPPFTATIGGPYEVPESESCTWQGFGSGGSGSYTFTWSGVLSGTGSYIIGTVASSGTLYLTVNDGSQNAYAQRYITVDEDADPCFEQQ